MTDSSGQIASQTLRAALGIRELAFSGAVAPGERLSEIALSERLGLSRTPIRAAFQELAHEGLLEPMPRGGYVVRSFSMADVTDAIELRGVLEGTAARLAAERGAVPAEMRVLSRVLDDLDAIVANGADMDFEAYVDRNAAFHDAIPRLAGSRLIAREVERVSRMPFAGPNAFLRVQAAVPAFRASLGAGQMQHRAIVQAIEAREGARAEALAREHARLAKHNLVLAMADRTLAPEVPGLRLVTG